MEDIDELPTSSPRHSLFPVSRIETTSGWRPILEAPNQVVLYNPSSHALTVTTNASNRALQSAPVPQRNARVYNQAGPTNCPYCHQPLDQHAMSDPDPIGQPGLQRHGHPTDPHSRVPNYFQLLAAANESSRPTSPYRSSAPSSSSSVHLETEDEPTPLTGDRMAQGYFQSFFREKHRLGMGANGTVLLCEHVLDGNVLGEYAVKKVAVGHSHDYLLNTLREVSLLR